MLKKPHLLAWIGGCIPRPIFCQVVWAGEGANIPSCAAEWIDFKSAWLVLSHFADDLLYGIVLDLANGSAICAGRVVFFSTGDHFVK